MGVTIHPKLSAVPDLHSYTNDGLLAYILLFEAWAPQALGRSKTRFYIAHRVFCNYWEAAPHLHGEDEDNRLNAYFQMELCLVMLRLLHTYFFLSHTGML